MASIKPNADLDHKHPWMDELSWLSGIKSRLLWLASIVSKWDRGQTAQLSTPE